MTEPCYSYVCDGKQWLRQNLFSGGKFIWPIVLFAALLLSFSPLRAASFYVSPSGNDEHSGTCQEAPLDTVQKAIDKMNRGDTLVLLDGVYTGTLKLKSGITLRALHPRKVIFSGAQPLSGRFEPYKGKIYRIAIPQSPKQVFWRGQPMTWARWPNMKWEENWRGEKKWLSSAKGTGPGVLTCEAFRQIKGLDLRGAYCFLRYSKGNSCFSREVKSFDGEVLHWDDTNFYSTPFTGGDGRRGSPFAIQKGKAKPNVRARFFLAGALSLLDTGGEWVAQDGYLYFQAPDGKRPEASDVWIQNNDYVIYTEEPVADVTIEGIDFFATSVKLPNPANRRITVRNAWFTYIGGELFFMDDPYGGNFAKPVHVGGTEIAVERSLFAGAQNTALRLVGAKVKVSNCVFMENNRNANFQSVGLNVTATSTFKIVHNTFINNCSDALRINFDHKHYVKSGKPDISYNHIFNAGLYNTDVSGVYMPHLSQYDTQFHHNWVHNVKGNGVRLDQAGIKLSVHHNVFWASKRGLNIEGYGMFNIYNNTSAFHREADILTRNVLPKRKGVPPEAKVSNDTSFPPITDWNVLNNLIQRFFDRVGPSEGWALAASKAKGKLHPLRARNTSIPITDRGSIQGNITGFDPAKIFVGGSLNNLNLIPATPVVRGGVKQTPELAAQGITALDSFRGAYDYGDKGWVPGSDWLPFGLQVPKSMAMAEKMAKHYRFLSIVPQTHVHGLPFGRLSEHCHYQSPEEEVAQFRTRQGKTLKMKNNSNQKKKRKKRGNLK
ncbi:MAG: hypothetical protein D6820_05285 [Lentisphaerae bacterium]|nr:MAG: hypothetical protein D6820_05285 [Lentisphaerota bacterium]